MRRVLAVFAVIVLFAACRPSDAQLRVLFLGYESSQTKVHNVFLDIMGSDPRFDLANSTSLDGIQDGLPSLATLQQYDAVLLWVDALPDLPITSNRFADYVDSGGGVVVATFWGQEAQLSGRLATPGYLPLTSPNLNPYSAASLGLFNASDPLFASVSTLSATTFRGDYNPGLDSGATLAGSWSDGRPLAAYNSTHKVVAITLFPDVWQQVHATGDYRELFRNGLALAGGPPAPQGGDPSPEPGTLALASALIIPTIVLILRRKWADVG
jgi:hypothetical protein